MRIGRTLPPAAAPMTCADLWHGLRGLCSAGPSIQAIEGQIREDFGVSHAFLVSSGTAALTITLMALKARAVSEGCSQERRRHPGVYVLFGPGGGRQGGTAAGPLRCRIHVVRLRPRSARANAERSDAVRRRASSVRVSGRDEPATHALPRARGRAGRGRGPGDGRGIRRAAPRHAGRRGALQPRPRQEHHLRRRRDYRDQLRSDRRGDCSPLRPAERAVDCRSGARLRPDSADGIFVRPWLYWVPAAMPFLGLGRTTFPTRIRLRRLSGLQAGLLRSWRSRLAESNRRRAETAAYFRRRLPSRFASDVPRPWLRLPIVAVDARERARVYSASQKRGLGLSLAYPAPINEIPEMRPAFAGQRFPSARNVVRAAPDAADPSLAFGTRQRRDRGSCAASVSRMIPVARLLVVGNSGGLRLRRISVRAGCCSPSSDVASVAKATSPPRPCRSSSPRATKSAAFAKSWRTRSLRTIRGRCSKFSSPRTARATRRTTWCGVPQSGPAGAGGRAEGKEAAQQLAVERASGSILIFSDVGTALAPDGISTMVRNFADPTVGCVSSVDAMLGTEAAGSGEGAYVRYEMRLRMLETAVHSLVGLSGSFFAARREVCRKWTTDRQSDFSTLLNAVDLGFRGVLDPASIGYYRNIVDERRESERKVRTVVRGIAVRGEQRPDAEPVPLRPVCLAAGEPQALPLVGAVCHDRRGDRQCAHRPAVGRLRRDRRRSAAVLCRGRARHVDRRPSVCGFRRFCCGPTSRF